MKKLVDTAVTVAVGAVAVAALLQRRSQPVTETAGVSDPAHVAAEAVPNGALAFAKNVAAGVKDDRVPLMSAAIAFYAFLASVPAMVAVVSVYGLVADPAMVSDQIKDFTAAVPEAVAEFVESQLIAIAAGSTASLSLGLALAMIAALWGASKAAQTMIKTLNDVYDVEDSRGFVAQRGIAVVFTFASILAVVGMLLVATLVPRIADELDAPGAIRSLIQIGRWPLFAAFVIGGLALMYRYAPHRKGNESWRNPLLGGTVAAVIWVVASLGLEFYSARIGSYNETYGVLGSIIVLQTWLLLSGLAVLVGAEVDDVLSRRQVSTGPGG